LAERNRFRMISNYRRNPSSPCAPLAMLAAAGIFASVTAPAYAAPPAGYKLSWSDEFNQGVGAAPDGSKWDYHLGKNNANAELEVYVNDRDHAHIEADPTAEDGQALQILSTNTNGYESVRMSTSGKHPIQYGFVEARIKLPYGQGIWPAFWMLGTNIGKVGWPACGEIDIMENIGLKSWDGQNLSSLHSSEAENVHGDYTKNAPYKLADGKTFHDDYHLFQMLWIKDAISFYVDGNLYETRTIAEYGKNPWPFNAPFFFIVNTALGGAWPGNPDKTTVWPQNMMVDYVRVYDGASQTPSAPVGLQATPAEGKQILVSWKGDINATSYNLYRGTKRNGGDAALVKTGIAVLSYMDVGLSPGTRYYYRVAAVNPAGVSGQSKEASATAIVPTESPYYSKPIALPGKIEIEDYDRGGEGLGYHDSDGFVGTATYRPFDGVDIENTNDTGKGFDVGWSAAGEWLKYTVNVAKASTYTVSLRASAAGKGGTVHIEDESGKDLTGPIVVLDTGGWQNWQTVTGKITLPAGKQTLKLVEDTGGYNLNWMTFTR